MTAILIMATGAVRPVLLKRGLLVLEGQQRLKILEPRSEVTPKRSLGTKPVKMAI